MARTRTSRRELLKSAVAAMSAAGAEAGGVPAMSEGPRTVPTPRFGDYLAFLDEGEGKVLELATEDNIEGPFYRPGAPMRTTLFDPGEKGEVLCVLGTVVARNGLPLAGALIEVWQATAAGRYDNDDPRHPPAPDEFRLRARLTTDEDGRYEFVTVKPGAYKIGPGLHRPAHIHIKTCHDGYRSLTTPLYFPGDRYNKIDPWFKPSLVLATRLEEGGKRLAATFNFVLPRV